MNRTDESFDLRDIIRDAIVRRGITEGEAARLIDMPVSALREVIIGGRSLSSKAFNAMVNKWGVRGNQAELQRWLVAFLQDRLGTEGTRWWKLAGWPLEPALPVVEDPGRELYAKLGDTRVQALRRLSILRATVAAPEGAKSVALCSAGRETRDVTDNDIKALVQRGLLSSTVVRTALSHVQVGSPVHVHRAAALRVWRATDAGKTAVTRMAALPDIRGTAEVVAMAPEAAVSSGD